MNIFKKQRTLLLFFLGNIILATLSMLILLKIKGPEFGENIESNVTLERYSIVFTLLAIPLALKLFHIQWVKILKKEGFPNRVKAYTNQFLIRILILDAAIIFNLVSFYFYESTNFIYMSIITIFALAFTYPNKQSWIELEEQNIDDDNITKED